MVLAEVHLEGGVVEKVLLGAACVSAVAEVATLVLISAVSVQFVIPVEPLSTEPALWVAFEATLIHGTRVVVAKLLVLAQFGRREQLVLMRKDLFVSRTEIAARPDLSASIWR